jgi:PhnB protein
MATINPYLNFAGNTEEAFNFYRSVFGGEFKNLTRFKDTPEAARVQENEKDKLMHVALPVGKGNALMVFFSPEICTLFRLKTAHLSDPF